MVDDTICLSLIEMYFSIFTKKCNISFENKLSDGHQKRKTRNIYLSDNSFFIAYFPWRIFPNLPLAIAKRRSNFSLFLSLPLLLTIFVAPSYLIVRRSSRVLYSLHATTFALKLLHPSRVSHRNPPEQMANTACSHTKTCGKKFGDCDW